MGSFAQAEMGSFALSQGGVGGGDDLEGQLAAALERAEKVTENVTELEGRKKALSERNCDLYKQNKDLFCQIQVSSEPLNVPWIFPECSLDVV
jgi:hypothetical protein